MHFGYSLHSAFNQEVGITRYNSYKFDDLYRYVPIDWSADPGGNYFFWITGNRYFTDFWLWAQFFIFSRKSQIIAIFHYFHLGHLY